MHYVRGCVLECDNIGMRGGKLVKQLQKRNAFAHVCWQLQQPLPPPFKPNYMKIQKVLFFLPAANQKVSKRFGFEPLTTHELFILYSVQYMPSNCSQQAILRHARDCDYTLSEPSVSRYTYSLRDRGLIDFVDGRISLSSLGRDYLSSLRRFLLNRRLWSPRTAI